MSGADMSEIISQNANMPFLPKPFDGETLKEKVQAILGPPPRAATTNQPSAPARGPAAA
jgi:hypothetical protein